MNNNCNQYKPNCFPSNCYIIGPTGPTGPAGSTDSATVTVGSTTTGEPGTNASVTNSGTAENVILDFVIPRGATGPAGEDGITPTFTIGTVETGEPGTDASVTITEN